MGGMPSARGCEHKGRYEDKSHTKFQESFDRIPRDKDGKMIWEPEQKIIQEEVFVIPSSCSVCNSSEYCSVECAHGSIECQNRIKND
jgi:hypothetical protein